MIKYLFILLTLFYGCTSVTFSQNLKVIVEGNTKLPLHAFSVNKKDTTSLMSINDSLFSVKEDFVGRKMLIKYGNFFIDIGLLDKEAKNIKIIYNPIAKNECVVINKIYYDVAQSNFGPHLSRCYDFHQVIISSTENQSNINEAIKIRRINN